MNADRLSPASETQGYVSLAKELRDQLSAGRIAIGQSLPTVRELGAKYGVSRETARRAVKELEADGLVACEPRHGYRVQARVNDPDRGLPVAFVMTDPTGPGAWNLFRQMIFAALQQAASARGWSLLAVDAGARPARDVAGQLQGCRACGMILDTNNPELTAAVGRMGLPVVMVDSWDPDMALDAVVQDGFQGALLAVRHLAARGHKRIGWLGPVAETAQSSERFGGAVAGMARAGLRLEPELLVDTSRAGAAEAARKMLARSKRPTAALGLWHEAAAALHRAARERGLVPGKGLEIVGWSPEEQYEAVYRPLFGGDGPPATMVWSAAELARAAVRRLAERRAEPKLRPALIKIPVALRGAEK
jgi:LacI family transcriptional regulator